MSSTEAAEPCEEIVIGFDLLLLLLVKLALSHFYAFLDFKEACASTCEADLVIDELELLALGLLCPLVLDLLLLQLLYVQFFEPGMRQDILGALEPLFWVFDGQLLDQVLETLRHLNMGREDDGVSQNALLLLSDVSVRVGCQTYEHLEEKDTQTPPVSRHAIPLLS